MYELSSKKVLSPKSIIEPSFLVKIKPTISVYYRLYQTYLFLALFGGTPAPSPFSGAASTSPFAGSGAPVFGGPASIGKLNFKLKITQIR